MFLLSVQRVGLNGLGSSRNKIYFHDEVFGGTLGEITLEEPDAKTVRLSGKLTARSVRSQLDELTTLMESHGYTVINEIKFPEEW